MNEFGKRNEFLNKPSTEKIDAVRAPYKDILIFSFINRQICTKLGIYVLSQENTQKSHFVIVISNTKARTSEVGRYTKHFFFKIMCDNRSLETSCDCKFLFCKTKAGIIIYCCSGNVVCRREVAMCVWEGLWALLERDSDRWHGRSLSFWSALIVADLSVFSPQERVNFSLVPFRTGLR